MIRIFVQPGHASDFEIALYAVILAAAWLSGTLLTERWAYQPARRASGARGLTIRRAVPQRRHVAHGRRPLRTGHRNLRGRLVTKEN